MWKFNGKIKKEQWLLILLAGAVLMILAMPAGTDKGEKGTLYDMGEQEKAAGRQKPEGGTTGNAGGAEGGITEKGAYEETLEARIREILKNVEGVGTVDVMIVLKSTEEKVVRVDQRTSSSSTKEQDSQGGVREALQSDLEETTIMTDSGDGSQPIIEKEIYPEISGIIISASGGGSPQVQAEISEAMEALFGLPAHKIKVLKRVE